MNKKIITILIAAVLLSGLILLTGCSAVKEEAIYKEETVSLNDVSVICIQSESTDIKIIEEERDDVKAVLKTYEEGPRFDINTGNTIHIKVHENDGYTLRIQNYSPLLTVHVPSGFDGELEINGMSADIEMRNIELTSVSINTDSGDISGDDWIIEKLDIETESGDVDINNVDTEMMDIITSSGDVYLNKFEGNLDGETRSGEVVVRYNSFIGTLDYVLSSGDLTAILNQENLNVSLELEADDISIDLDGESIDEEYAFDEKYGDGEHQIRVKTNSGDIEIK